MKKMINLLDNCGETIKKISKFCFLFFMLIAIIYFILGAVNTIGAVSTLFEYYDSFTEILYNATDYSLADIFFGTSEEIKTLYTGLLLCILSASSFFTSILSLPVYGFGCIIDDVKSIKEKIKNEEVAKVPQA